MKGTRRELDYEHHVIEFESLKDVECSIPSVVVTSHTVFKGGPLAPEGTDSDFGVFPDSVLQSRYICSQHRPAVGFPDLS